MAAMAPFDWADPFRIDNASTGVATKVQYDSLALGHLRQRGFNCRNCLLGEQADL